MFASLRMAAAAAMARAPLVGKHTVPALPYAFDALAPTISAEIMTLHVTKHHAAYVKNLNTAEEQYEEAIKTGDLTRAIALQSSIKFNGGGHLNHSIFWTNLAPKGDGGGNPPAGDLLAEIEKTWGSFDAFKEKMSAASAAVQGSGWGWLGYNRTAKRLEIATCANQDPLEPTTGLVPLLGIDVWEHSYYLDYKNDRMLYVKSIWNVVNWKNVTERYTAAKATI